MYEHVVETQYMNLPGVLSISVLVIAPEGTMWQINVYMGWGGGVYTITSRGGVRIKMKKGVARSLCVLVGQ